MDHLLTEHLDELSVAMQCFQALRPCVKEDEKVLAISVYNEGIAHAVRRGAPLASYSIDRKCLQQYASHLTHGSTSALVCFVCARRFVKVSGSKDQAIEYQKVVFRRACGPA